jgi:type II secretory pathway pseudopilin PulG
MTENAMKPNRTPVAGSAGEAGFTLVEAIIAILILIVGLMGITNLFIVAASSNSAANKGTATATEASEILERLKAVPFLTLTTGGDLNSDQGTIPNCNPDAQDCAVAGNFNSTRDVSGVGRIRSRWQIIRPGAGGPDTLFIEVRSEAIGAFGSAMTRADFTTYRTCTTAGCPF